MRHMGYFGTLAQPPYGDLELPYLPGMDRTRPSPKAPHAGEHTRAVLAEFGCGADEIAALERSGVVVQRS
jgi:crotonobetainyl-CoA:carnitine CoA-transferase CaiB-like acyl-CoA transferase